MRNPVMAADSFTYERCAIEAWLAKSNLSPMTNEPLPNRALMPNSMVRSAIRQWLQP